jgi:hypothetical protein
MKSWTHPVSSLGLLCAGFSCVSAAYDPVGGIQEPMIDPIKYKAACPDYKNYAMRQQYVVSIGHTYYY